MSLGTILLIINADRRNTELATQQKLGLWSQRRNWAGIDHRHCSAGTGTIVMTRMHLTPRRAEQGKWD
jgi:hypothetical protein